MNTKRELFILKALRKSQDLNAPRQLYKFKPENKVKIRIKNPCIAYSKKYSIECIFY